MLPLNTTQLIDALLRYRWGLACGWIILSAIGLWGLEPPASQRSIDRLFDSKDGDLRAYQQTLTLFGPAEPILVAYEDPQAFASDGTGIERVKELAHFLDSLPGVVETVGVADLDELVSETFSSHIQDGSVFSERLLDVLEGLTHSADRQTISIICLLDKRQSSDSRHQTLQRIRSWLKERSDSYPMHAVVGEPVMVDQGFELLERDGARLSLSASVLLAIVLMVTFRSWRWVFIAGLVVQTSLAVVKFFLAITGLQITIVSAMFGSVVTVIAVAAIMHWIVRYREQQQLCADSREAFHKTFQQILAPTFWSCATDAAGFASLMIASVEPVRDFGLLMIVGCTCVFLSLIFLVPALATAPLPTPLRWLDSTPTQSPGSTWLDRRLEQLLDSVRLAPRRWGALVALIVIGLTLGLFRVTVESDFTRNFRASSEISRDYQFVETRLGGAGVWEVVVPIDGELDWDSLQHIRKLEDRLRDEVVFEQDGVEQPGLVQVFSIADALLGVLPFDLEKLPLGKDWIVSQGLAQFERRMPGLLESVVAKQPESGMSYVRILLRSKQRLPSQIQESIIESVKEICREESESWPASQPPLVTGWYVLLARIVDHLLADQLTTLIVATAAILGLVWIATRRFNQALLALVPNLMPIGAVLGTLGWLGIPINMGVALIAAVSVGLSIDSTIHYLDVVRRRMNLGVSQREALSAAQHRAGSASVFSTIALTAGFATMVGSEFLPTVYFGTLVCAAMLGGLIGNLLVLPLLLVSFDSEHPTGNLAS